MTRNIDSSISKTHHPDDFPILDAAILPLVNQAEEGCLHAQEQLYYAFCNGNGAKPNYEIAKYYLDMSFESLDDTENYSHKEARYIILWKKVLLEGQFNGRERMKTAFFEMIDYMREHIPLEDWDFSELTYFGELLQLEDD